MRNILTIAIVISALICISRTPTVLAASPDGNGLAISQKVTLLNNIEVDQNLVKIGDLFTNTGDKAEIEVAYAEHLCSRNDSFEKLRFVNSGTEAIMATLKASRAFSGKPKIAKVEGAYHGQYD